MTAHQQRQVEVINQIEAQVSHNSLSFSTVTPVEDFDNDLRVCFTSVHIPSDSLKQKIKEEIIKPLKEVTPEAYYYSPDSMHMTIKNIKVISNPPNFTSEDIKKAIQVFSEVIPNHKKFKVYFYRLLLFPNNLALIGTTDEELDKIILALDQRLREARIPDDKVYLNSQYFFCNMTLARFDSSKTRRARFSTPISQGYKDKAKELSDKLSFKPYEVDSVSLITANAVLKKLQVIQTWKLG